MSMALAASSFGARRSAWLRRARSGGGGQDLAHRLSRPGAGASFDSSPACSSGPADTICEPDPREQALSLQKSVCTVKVVGSHRAEDLRSVDLTSRGRALATIGGRPVEVRKRTFQ